jgi:hypothetical protein
MIAGAVFFVLLAIFTARFVTGGRGLLIGRLAGILSIYILVWLFIGISSPSTAVEVARFFAGGGAEAVTGLTHFLNHLFGSR